MAGKPRLSVCERTLSQAFPLRQQEAKCPAGNAANACLSRVPNDAFSTLMSTSCTATLLILHIQCYFGKWETTTVCLLLDTCAMIECRPYTIKSVHRSSTLYGTELLLFSRYTYLREGASNFPGSFGPTPAI